MQVSEFEGGGTSISLSCPHMLADPISVSLLIKSWAESYRKDVVVHPPFLHPQAFSIPPTFTDASSTTTTTSPVYYASKSTTLNPNPNPNPKGVMVSATFNFSDLSLGQSLAMNCSTLPDATPFDLLTALFWTCIAKLKAQDILKYPISICTDIRKRLHAPLPHGYFGNALHFSRLSVDPNITDCDIGQVTELVHQHVAGLKEDEFWSAVQFLNCRKDDQGKFLPPFNMYGPELTCVNMESMIAPIGTHVNESWPFMYGVEFLKNQKPTHVSYHVENTEGEGLIWVMPSLEGGLARRVTVTLPEEEMEKLLQDKVILNLEPTLLLSGRS